MITPSISNFFIYFSLAWSTNILLNFLYVLKRYVPKTKAFDRPIDGGLMYKGDRLVGESTTLAGLALSLTVSVILHNTTHNIIWSSIPLLVYMGHMVGSMIKRRMHKKSGEFVPFIDHGDYMVFTGTVLLLSHSVTFSFAILAVLLTYILHPIACFVAYRLKLREYPY